METATPIDMLCRIIIRAREYEAQVPTNYDGDESPDNVDGDDDDEAYSVLDDDLNTSVEEELQGALDDLAEDQIAEVLALCWVGTGDYDASDWDEALQAAGEERHIVDQLMEMPMLASVLESGMAAFELDCDGVGELT
ncbi:DUF3775 domain-containing protein [Sphingomicrobium nitratireducens]|uniref:DUF3775 domain-containing protein n=1 Tax=Sphingomicrobium nitratireducens TaxID=2964666 RepID=UPI0022409C55|nr:DUF3775 domain-containing protein [Sphingomicrobium nitratireducens]